ncbi:unnamed protein product [Caretta caretta]
MNTTQASPELSASGKVGSQNSKLHWKTGEKDSFSAKKPSESEEASGSGGAINAGDTMTNGDGWQLRRSG